MHLNPFVSRSVSPLFCGLLFLFGAAAAPGLAGDFASRAQAAELAAKTKKPDMARVRAHLQKHVTYPATRAEVLAACATTPEFSAEEKAWFAAALPEHPAGRTADTFASADEVLKSLKN